MAKLFLVSNMYPSKNNPSFGIFVKNFELSYTNLGGQVSPKVVIDKIFSNPFARLLSYIKHYLNILYQGFSRDYDIIYVHYAAHNALPVLLLKILSNRKVIVNVHGDDILPTSILVKFLQFFVDKLLARCELIVVPSQFFKEILIERNALYTNKIYISPSGGVDLDIFNVSKALLGHNQNDRIVLGYVSRIDKGKGWNFFLQLIQRLIKENNLNVYGIVVGKGRESEAMITMIQSLKLMDRIQCFNNVDHSSLPSVYSLMDLFIFPTILSESLGLVGIEAMACKLPIIGSNIGGLRTYISNGNNGYLFEPGNLDDLYEKTLQYIQLPIGRKEIFKANSLKTAQMYDRKIIAESLFFKIKTIMARTPETKN